MALFYVLFFPFYLPLMWWFVGFSQEQEKVHLLPLSSMLSDDKA